MQEEDDILERLKHPEKEKERRRTNQNLFVRNILNSLFMIAAAVAMVGILTTSEYSPYRQLHYGLVFLAIIIKMVEVVLRTPLFNKRT